MNQDQRTELKTKILKRYELYRLNNSRLKRLVKDPIRTFIFYTIAILARIKPFKIKMNTLWGEPMTYYLPEGQAILYYGFFEANLTNYFINNLKEGDVFVDIGAHVGFYSLLASSLVGHTGSVHSFEPTPRTFISLQENLINKPNVKVNNYALLDEEKIISFMDYGPKYSAFNSFQNRTSADIEYITREKQKIEVKTLVLDKYFSENNVLPTHIKIDAEGAEYLILNGMNKTLSSLRPIVTIEVAGGEEWKKNCHDSIEILKHHGYVAHECDLNGNLTKHTEQDSYGYDNLIFVPQEKVS